MFAAAKDEKVVNGICQWLKSRDLELGSPNIVESSIHRLPFVGRTSTVESIKELFNRRWAERFNPTHKASHPLGMMGSSPGIGKTRILVETPRILQECIDSFEAEQYSWFDSVLITYNCGFPPIDAEISGDDAQKSRYFALRVLFFMIKDIRERFTNFRNFCEAINAENWSNDITLSCMVKLIAHLKNRACTPAKPIILIGVDEYNILLEKSPGALENVIRDLSTLIQTETQLFVFPLLLGTLNQPLKEIITRSQYEYTELPVNMLEPSDLARIIIEGELLDHFFTKNVRHTFYDYGRLPRMAERFLIEVKKISEMHGTVESNLDDIKRKLDAELGKKVDIVGPQSAKQIVADIILKRPVWRNSQIGSTTYGELENKGVIVISGAGAECLVSMPTALLKLMVSTAKTDYKKDGIGQLDHVLQNYDSATMTWQRFEEFCLLFASIKEMLLSESENDSMELSDLYSGVIGDVQARQRNVSLSKIVEFKKSCTQITTEDPPGNGDDSIWLNGTSSTYDGFRDYRLSLGPQVRHRVVIQAKLYMGKEKVTRVKVEKEAERVRKCFDSSQYGNHNYTLIIMATQVEEIRPDQIPEDCLILSGENLKNFLGSPLAHQIIGIYPDSLVNVNTNDVKTLQLVVGIGNTIAKAIVEERDQHGEFKNLKDLKSRIPQLRPPSEDFLFFSHQQPVGSTNCTEN